MSRGPGWIERAIHELFGAHPELAFVTDELAEHCFPDADKIERKHQVSVLRAAHKVVALDPDWTEWRIEYQGRGWVFLNHANVQSYALARLISEQFMPDPDEYLAKLGTDDYRKLIASDGTWARFMQEHCAKRDGDAELAAALRARHDAEMAARSAAFRKRYPARNANQQGNTYAPLDDQLAALGGAERSGSCARWSWRDRRSA